jgi:hypothetical protein
LWKEIDARQSVFSGAFAYGSTGAVLTIAGESRPVNVAAVSGGFFSTLRVSPASGRLLAESDDRAGCAGRAVITHAFWQREYGGRTDAVGSTLMLDGAAKSSA